MSKAHGSRRHYIQLFRYPCRGAPRFERGVETVEVEEPYRIGTGCILRLGPRRALVAGRWGTETQDEAAALYGALKATDMDVPAQEIVTWTAPEGEPDVPVRQEPQPVAPYGAGAPCGAPVLAQEGGGTYHF